MVQLPTRMPLNPGDIIRNRYRVIRLLGEGGFGETYLVEDLDCFNREKALKRLTDPYATQEARELFQREAELLLRLGNEHPQIPQIFAYFSEDGRFYIAQEYIQGHCLNEELTSPWSEENVINFLNDILEILLYTHQQGVIHRDIKPTNLIRQDSDEKSDQKIVLIDFGAATVRRTDHQTTPTRIIGTRGYAAAEQLMGYPQFSSDIYAVGVVAIQALTGNDPSQEQWQLNNAGQFIWRNQVNISPKLADIIDKMTAYDFRQRYQSVEEVLADLENRVPPEPPPSDDRWQWIKQIINYLGSKPKNNLSLKLAAIGSLGGLGLLIVLALMANPYKACERKLGDFASCGEEILIHNTWQMMEGIKSLNQSNYEDAIKWLQQSWQNDEKRNHPETLIYLNNALLEAKNLKYYTLAVAVPILHNDDGTIKDSELAEELLRGVAQAQTEVNLALLRDSDLRELSFPGKIFLKPKQFKNNRGLKVIILDDSNNQQDSLKRAKTWSKNSEILGIIGHYASEITRETIDIYTQNKLSLISPGTTTEYFTGNPNDYFFRTVPNIKIHAEKLTDYFFNQLGQTQATIFYNPKSPYTASFRVEFERKFQELGGKLVQLKQFDLSHPNFNPQKAIEELANYKNTAIILAPDGQVTNALGNAIALIEANQGRHWIGGTWSVYSPKTLEIQDFKSLEKLILFTPWHYLRSPNPEFAENAQQLWGGWVSPRTALAYDATRVLIQAIKKQSNPTRQGMQQVLSSPTFIADGATGTIEFDPSTHNRKNPPGVLVKVLLCNNSKLFVPMQNLTCP